MTNTDIIVFKNDLIAVVNKHKHIPAIVKGMVVGEVQGILGNVMNYELENENKMLELEKELENEEPEKEGVATCQ